MEFKNPLSQYAYDQCNSTLQLQENTIFDDLKVIRTLNGDAMGAIQVFHGERIQKFLISEFVTGPGMVASLVSIVPEYQYDIPRYGSDFSVMGENIHLDMDLFPHKDMALDIDYYQRHYQPLEETFTEAINTFDSKHLKGLWLRHFTSPCFFIAEAKPQHTNELQKVAEKYLDQWLTIWQAETTIVSETQVITAKTRADNFARLSLEHNPVKTIFNKVLGEAVTQRILTALY